MADDASAFPVRAAMDDDRHGLVDLLNEIVRVGGTTAIETPLDPATFADWFLDGARCLSCFVADAPDGVALGFQALGTHAKLPPACGDIATFVRLGHAGRGIGRALFRRTVEAARKAGLTELNATIRADNDGGLGFYSRLGFVDHHRERDVPLQDGTAVDRLSKRYAVHAPDA